MDLDKNIAYKKALAVMRNASSANGFLASTIQTDNYARVWTRDGVICGIAALASGESDLIETFKQTLITIFSNQHEDGFMPSNVATNGNVSYGGIVGRVDNPSWAIIGLCLYAQQTQNMDFARQYKTQVEKAFSVMSAWEFNGKHLMYSPISANWADEYIQQGYVLFDQLLRLYALRLAAKVFNCERYLQKSKTIQHIVEQNYWHHSNTNNLYSVSLERMYHQMPKNQWCMGFTPSQVFTQFDLQSQSLALILGLGNEEIKETVVNNIEKKLNEKEQILASFSPPIQSKDDDYTILKNNYAYEFRNKPYEFHNGGLWPVWNGIAAAAVQPYNAQLALKLEESIHQANAISSINGESWQFNECLHGLTFQAIGIPFCTWSAAGAVLAHSYNQTNKTINLHEN